MKILILGKNGQVGRALQQTLAGYADIIALGSQPEGGLTGDLRQIDALRSTIRDIAPKIIVNAGAYTAVDKAESEPELAMQINGIAPGVLAEEAKRLNSLLIHYSTDYVFDGIASQPLQETDTTSPQNVYGKTKLAGEQAIQQIDADHLIFRTCWVYADQGHNFIHTMLRLARERDQLKVVDDQIGAPTSAELIASVTALAIKRWQSNHDFTGLYHLSAHGRTSWYAYARYILECAANEGASLKVSANQIQAIPTTLFPTPAKRPMFSLLSSHKLEQALGVTLPDWHDDVAKTCHIILRQVNTTV